jgi:hypothetical protein
LKNFRAWIELKYLFISEDVRGSVRHKMTFSFCGTLYLNSRLEKRKSEIKKMYSENKNKNKNKRDRNVVTKQIIQSKTVFGNLILPSHSYTLSGKQIVKSNIAY